MGAKVCKDRRGSGDSKIVKRAARWDDGGDAIALWTLNMDVASARTCTESPSIYSPTSKDLSCALFFSTQKPRGREIEIVYCLRLPPMARRPIPHLRHHSYCELHPK